MSMVDTVLGFAKANPAHTLKVGMKVMQNFNEITSLMTKMGLTEQDLLGFVQPAGTPIAPVAAPSSATLPALGFMRDHEGKDYKLEDLGKQLLAQARELEKTTPPNVTPTPITGAPRSCLGCRDALNGTDQPSYAKACGSNNCKGNPDRPNYAKI